MNPSSNPVKAGPAVQGTSRYRLINLVLFLASAIGMAFALYLQHYQYLDPCPMCIFQRVGLIGMGVFALLAFLVNPKTLGVRRLWATLMLLPLLWSASVAARQVWIQHFPPDDLSSCGGASLDFMMQIMPFQQVVRDVLYGSGDCAKIDWTWLGLSLPHWALFFFIALLGLILSQFRRQA